MDEVKLLPCELRRMLNLGVLSLTSFDGHAIRIDFPNRKEAEQMFKLLGAIATRPPIVTDEVVEPQSVGDHALPPSGLSQSSLSQAKPAAAIARDNTDV